MIKVTLELDYPNITSAMENTNLSALINFNKCISFSHKECVPSIIEYSEKRKEHEAEIYKNMNIDPNSCPNELKEAIKNIAYKWAGENYYYKGSSI